MKRIQESSLRTEAGMLYVSFQSSIALTVVNLNYFNSLNGIGFSLASMHTAVE